MPLKSRSGRLLLAAGALFLVVTLAIDWWSRRGTRSAAGRQPVRLTTDGGLSTEPAISPDGRLLAWASDRGGAGNLDLWLRPLAGGTPVRLTSDPADDHQPDFSPDAARLAYRSERDGGGIFVVPASGGTPTLLLKGGNHPRFSPDGRSVACWTRGAEGRGEAWVIPSAGGTPRRIAADLRDARQPIWSPEGQYLMLAGSGERRSDWWVVPAASGAAVPTGVHSILRTQGLRGDLVPAVWAHGRILFAATFRDVQGLWEVPISDIRQCSGVAKPVTRENARAAAPAEARDGTMVYAALTSQAGLWRLPADAEPQRIPTSASPTGGLTLSGNGKLLFRASDANILKDLASGEEKKLDAAEPAVLSRDGRFLAYGSRGGIHTVPVDSGEPKRVCERCGPPWDWSPDGTMLLYSLGRVDAVGVLNIATGAKRELRWEEERRITSARFSPDGRRILLETVLGRRDPRRQILVAPFRDDVRTRIAIAEGAGREHSARWSPDGTAVYFFSDRDGFPCIWGRRTTGQPFAIRHFHGTRLLPAREQGMEVAGDAIVALLNETAGDIWMLR